MAKKNDGQIVRTLHTVARSETGLILPPLVLIPTTLLVASWINGQFDTHEVEAGVDFRYLVAITGFLLLFPIWAKIKTRFWTRYRITLDSVIEEHGLLSKTSSEIRIQDIRNIVVKQSILDRLLAMGNIHFSSAAGSGVEVKFQKVARPNQLKVLVRDIQAKLSDGELTEDEIREINETAGGKKGQAEADADESAGTMPTASGANPAGADGTTDGDEATTEETAEMTAEDEGTREELYRLLAEQADEGADEA